MTGKPQLVSLRLNAEIPDAAPRRVLYDGSMHTVVPAVLAVDGVMNGARVSAEELGRHVEAWNGRPVPILHPEVLGEPVSASASPEILANSVGWVFNAVMEDGRLKAEFWLNEEKIDALGYSELLASFAKGEVVEVSTGYFADDIAESGEYKGRQYDRRHVNIRPDHVAILPGEIGACSVGDGCGVPRTNRQADQTRSTVLNVLRDLLGIKANCDCEEPHMNREELLKAAKALVANKSISAEQLELLEGADDQQLEMMTAIIGALAKQRSASNADDPNGDEPNPDQMARNNGEPNNNRAGEPKPKPQGSDAALSKDEIGALVANQVRDTLKRERMIDRLATNAEVPFEPADLEDMTTDQLTKLDRKFSANYEGGGGGGMPNNNTAKETPLGLSPGVLRPRKSA